MGPTGNKPDKLLAAERLATDEMNWPLWKATLMSYFKSRNLLKHVDGTADWLPNPPTFPKGYVLTDDEKAKVDKAEERLEKYLPRRSGQDPDHIIC